MDSKYHLYRHWDKDKNLLYVGISLHAVVRLFQHKCTCAWFDQIASVTIEVFKNRQEAEIAERAAIRNESPLWNKSAGAPKKPNRDLRNITLRMPEELHAQLEKLAAENLRSLNAEIVLRLQESH